MSKKHRHPVFQVLESGDGGADVSGVTATAGDVDTGKVFVDSTGTEVTGTSTYKADYTALNTLVSGTTATAGDVDSGKLFVKSDGSQGSGTSTYKADYTALHTLVGQTTAVAEDVAQGKVFVNSSGVQTTGTASGGGNEDLVKMIERPNNSEITIPSGITKINSYTFYKFNNLRNIIMPNTVTRIEEGAFSSDYLMQQPTLPANLNFIGAYAFESCSSPNFNELTFPSSLNTLSNFAFSGCTKLTQVTFLGTPSYIGTSSFKNCSAITTIRVPWAQGAVSGAPFGAVNATLVYNYTP